MDEDILKWYRRQSAEVRVALPQRMPGEPDATPEQVEEIARLATNVDKADATTLGTWQAVYLIQRLREERRELEARAAKTAVEMQAQRNQGIFLLIVIVVLLAALLSWWLI